MLSTKSVQSFEAIRGDKVASMVKFIDRCSIDNPVNLSKLAFKLANSIICRVVFGRSDDWNAKFREILYETQVLLGEANIADFFPWMAWFNKLNGIESILHGFFNETEEHLDPGRFNLSMKILSMYCLEFKEIQFKRSVLSDNDIKDLLTDILIAGNDTSAATIKWTMAKLTRNPLAKIKAQQEVREVMKAKGKVEESDLSILKYLKVVIKESLRRHPPAPLLVPRETLESCKIGGYQIPVKTSVLINAASIATDPTSWENPLEFKPERFLNTLVDFKGQNFELLPCRAGGRSCPGIHFFCNVLKTGPINEPEGGLVQGRTGVQPRV